ncbi:MAG: PilZ domain-containing protein [Acidobacteria bacterium]|nr:PilZ domain-containing protein [Acidobacteriota bacterium]
MGVEQRKARRVPIVAQIEAQSGGFPFIAVTENISEGGLMVRTSRTIEQGQIVHLKFTLPDASQREIRANGIVQHCAVGQSIGIKFEDLDPADLAAIQTFVSAA